MALHHRIQRSLKGLMAAGLIAALAGASLSSALALDGSYSAGTPIGNGSFASSTYTVVVDDTAYQYATGSDGNAYYTTYDGNQWTAWTGWGTQPASYQYDPAPVAYQNQGYVVYAGDDGKYYASAGGGDWTDISGDYTFKYAPYANVYNDTLYVYGVASDGYVYWKDYNGAAWGEWGEIGGQTTAAYDVYAVDWNGYDNVFWTSNDGHVYWNRWDGSAWSGAKELTNSVAIASAPYAVGYAPEEKLYAYGVSTDGQPAWNVFTEGEGWTGWKPSRGSTSRSRTSRTPTSTTTSSISSLPASTVTPTTPSMTAAGLTNGPTLAPTTPMIRTSTNTTEIST